MSVASSGDFAPYYLSALSAGRIGGASSVQAEGYVWRPVEMSGLWSYGFGVDLIADRSSKIDYERYVTSSDGGKWEWHSMRQAAVRVQQLYGTVRYRSVFISAGMREYESVLLNQRLTSGDLIESNNARPIPQVRIGFQDFNDIPFTGGWLQIQGEIGYGKLIDNDWWRDHYNYYNSFVAVNSWYNYKRCYFRTRPLAPFSVTFGMQAAGQFGGYSTFYDKGRITRVQKMSSSPKTFFKMFLPRDDDGEGFYTGNHLGTWDMKARYKLKNGHEISGYFSWPFEDGSGIGKQNGWDGLWGIEYKSPTDGYVSGAVIEYLDFTNQSGPIHFNPEDYPGTTIKDHVSGSDDYYNHQSYNSYAYYGMSIGSPAFMAPFYNTDGYNRYVGNVMRGIHFGIEGSITDRIHYRVKGGYRKAWGDGYAMLPAPIHLSSYMIDVNWHPQQIDGLIVDARVGLDRGNMPCNSFGVLVSVKYNGLLNFR